MSAHVSAIRIIRYVGGHQLEFGAPMSQLMHQRQIDKDFAVHGGLQDLLLVVATRNIDCQELTAVAMLSGVSRSTSRCHEYGKRDLTEITSCQSRMEVELSFGDIGKAAGREGIVERAHQYNRNISVAIRIPRSRLLVFRCCCVPQGSHSLLDLQNGLSCAVLTIKCLNIEPAGPTPVNSAQRMAQVYN